MNAKPDEHPDHWVRQRLDQLPDAPPPGSTFDSERLWGQLQPQLPRKTVRRRNGVVWWAAAACLMGLLLNQVWPTQQDVGSRLSKIGARTPGASGEKTVDKRLRTADERNLVQSVYSVVHRKSLTANRTPAKLEPIVSLVEPVQVATQTPEAPVVIDEAPVASESTPPAKMTLVAATPKRRFRVMHVNELTAQEEARPKLYRTESFVRLGTSTSQPQEPTEPAPALIIPFASKPNH